MEHNDICYQASIDDYMGLGAYDTKEEAVDALNRNCSYARSDGGLNVEQFVEAEPKKKIYVDEYSKKSWIVKKKGLTFRLDMRTD